ncbi:unnamed protein product [Bursaphelenchus xylophilus]|uniref:(pine wood nematode) hypothetical protein n=1 Tax=Bursaphelenchus xylophilus TaxID=6326 RepID=A0A1I7RZ59_BURXY|nr:unnamed protein product [Bursaphelenchus xylophilus]CAG9106823.1 unnamed protein product [Bursaphelenchus xylophilus]
MKFSALIFIVALATVSSLPYPYVNPYPYSYGSYSDYGYSNSAGYNGLGGLWRGNEVGMIGNPDGIAGAWLICGSSNCGRNGK